MSNISFGLQSPQCSLAPGNHSTITGWREARNGGAIATIDTFVTIVIAGPARDEERALGFEPLLHEVDEVGV